MKPDDMDESIGALTLLPPLPPEVANDRRREARCLTDLPLRLTSGSGETFPAVMRNVSASGLLATADDRFSLLLPPPNGMRFDGEFFFDDVEVRDLLLEVIRVEREGRHRLSLGCEFVQPPADLATQIRSKVMARVGTGKRV